MCIRDSRIAVVGDSAGGNLAAAVALKARDEHGPRLGLQALLYPITDCSFDTASYQECASGFGLTRETMIFYWDCYLARPRDAEHPYASPLRAIDLGGVAPALILTAHFDPLRDEGLAYAAKLTEAGVRVECSDYLDMNHGFVLMGTAYPSARQALNELARAVRSQKAI